MEKAIVLCSGGLNSAVLLSLAKQTAQVACLHAKFAHRAAQRDAAQFGRLAAHYEVAERQVIEFPHFGAFGGSARIDPAIDMEDAVVISRAPAACWVPGLIGSLLHAALAYARKVGAQQIWLGAGENPGPPCPANARIYPDHTREYLQLIENAFSTLTPTHPIKIETPLIDLRRGDVIQLGRRLEVPFKLTWSCQTSNDAPCQRCVGCATRARGFIDAAFPDPLLSRAASTA